jgi:hypothetical protein
MKQVRAGMLSTLMVLLSSLLNQAQQSVATAASGIVPPLIQLSDVATDLNGKPLTGVVGVTFYLYKDQQGGSPLWIETQNVQPDKTGHYTVLLGSTTSQGLPASIFVSGEAHWLGVQVQGLEEQPRVLLVSAPYALKAGDAETVGGLPASAFVLAAPTLANAPNSGSNVGAGSDVGATALVSGSGTTDFVPLWTNNSVLGNSVLFQSGSGSTVAVGINTITPAATLDVNGNVISRGPLQLPSTGTATATQGFNSQPFDSVTSVFNSTGGAAQNQDFRWLAEPLGNNTSSPSGKLDLLFGANGATPAETGLSVASNGQITFATGQTFPGGGGTVTSVGSGLGLTGGPITGSGTLSINPTVIPLLNAANTFAANQTVNGTFTANSGSNGIVGNTTSTSGYGVEGSSPAIGVFGQSLATSGGGTGVAGESNGPLGAGVSGVNAATTGPAAGVYGTTFSTAGYGVEGSANSPAAFGVYGANTSATGNAVGVYGTTSSTAGYGVEGASSNIGVYGTGSVGVNGVTSAAAGAGVAGFANATTGFANGVFGANYSASGSGIAGVTGVGYASTGTTAGVLGQSNSSAGYGVEGIASVGGAAGYFLVANSSANILQGSNNGTSKFTVDSAGDVIAAGAVSGSGFQIGGQFFNYGSSGNENAFLGFAGSLNTNATVQQDTGVGFGVLESDTGGSNTAVGAGALANNTTGFYNTAIGDNAGFTNDFSNVTGNDDTLLGFDARMSTGSLINATAIGANAFVSESNALVLGQIGTSTNVGIGTSAPGHLLDVAGAVAFDSLGQNNGSSFIDLTFGLNAGEGMSSSRTEAPNQYGIDIFTDFTRRISIEQHGNVGIGTTSPDTLLSVNGGADKPGGGSWGTFSDARLKTVNGGFTDGLNQVMKIQPIHYRYKADNAMGIRDTDEHIGVVAQDVRKVIPEAVTENSKGYLLVNNDPIIWTMLNAIKEQQKEIKQQQNLLRAQSAAMRSLKAEVRETRESLRRVKAQIAAAQPALVAAK